MELQINLYVRHEDREMNKFLFDFFSATNCNSKYFISSIKDRNAYLSNKCKCLNNALGKELFDDFSSLLKRSYFADSLEFEASSEISGFTVMHSIYGSNGGDFVVSIIEFLNKLLPGVQAQAWGCGDDDPWEFWVKLETNREVSCRENTPGPGVQEIYDWWHETMPDSINEGLMGDSEHVEEIDFDEQYVVFTGKMEDGTREEMEELAEDLGAVVQKSINGKTTLLVIGDRPGQSKLRKAEKLGVKTITEEQFYTLIE
ncbi:MAG: BRCT domain-containing protein [Reinekea sp.]|jgi:NAD-dependent DNA ligase